MMTPEPIAPPFAVVTFTSTTAGRTFATTASRTVSRLLPDRAGTVPTGVLPGCKVVVLLFGEVITLVLPNCQPANRPTPKITASSTVNAAIAPVRKPRPPLRGADV